MPRPKANAAISTVEGRAKNPLDWWKLARSIVKLGKQYTPSTDKEKP